MPAAIGAPGELVLGISSPDSEPATPMIAARPESESRRVESLAQVRHVIVQAMSEIGDISHALLATPLANSMRLSKLDAVTISD
jgi:hypothetical protein